MLSDILCSSAVPTLIGMARAIGRSSDGEMPLISFLLSVHRNLRSEIVVHQPAAQQRRSFNTFRSILPRTMSALMLNSDLPSPTSPQGLLEMPEWSLQHEQSPSPLDILPVSEDGADLDPADIYFNKARTELLSKYCEHFECAVNYYGLLSCILEQSKH